MTTTMPRSLRADAQDNRDRVVDAARGLFAEGGLEVPMKTIADRAGVATATVYRRFPDREDLVEALFAERIDDIVGLAEAALQQEDSWAALVGFIEGSVRVQAGSRGLQQVMASSVRGGGRIAGARERLMPAVGAMLARAQATGGVRADVQVLDIAALTSLVSSVRAPELWRRYLVLLLDGLRENRTGVTPLPDAPPREIEMFVAGGAAGRRTNEGP